MTVNELYEKVTAKCAALGNLALPKNVDQVVKLYDAQIGSIVELLDYFCQSNEESFARNLFLDIAKEPCVSNGKVYEALTYAWLHQANIPFRPQPEIRAEDCLKNNNKSYSADGKIENAVFDIKQFGIGFPHIKTLQNKLQEKLPGYHVGIGGSRDIPLENINQLLQRIDDIANELLSDKTKLHTVHACKIDGSNLGLV